MKISEQLPGWATTPDPVTAEAVERGEDARADAVRKRKRSRTFVADHLDPIGGPWTRIFIIRLRVEGQPPFEVRVTAYTFTDALDKAMVMYGPEAVERITQGTVGVFLGTC